MRNNFDFLLDPHGALKIRESQCISWRPNARSMAISCYAQTCIHSFHYHLIILHIIGNFNTQTCSSYIHNHLHLLMSQSQPNPNKHVHHISSHHIELC